MWLSDVRLMLFFKRRGILGSWAPAIVHSSWLNTAKSAGRTGVSDRAWAPGEGWNTYDSRRVMLGRISCGWERTRIVTPANIKSSLQLGETAPLVRVTAGAGSAGQKTWNLRRPVTLIGTRRPAHIILHDKNVSAAHCVIVNTGNEVLVKDLHTSGGTFCNRDRIDLAMLNDGDVLTVGATTIQIAVCMPNNVKDDSGSQLEFIEPTKFREPVTISLEHGDKQWDISDAVTLIGRHWDAPVCLDSPEVSTRHAVLFRFAGGPAVFDLGSRTGVSVNGNPCSIGPLDYKDRLGIGPLTLVVGHVSDSTVDGGAETDRPTDFENTDSSDELPTAQASQKQAPVASDQCSIEQHADGSGIEQAVPTLGHIQSELNVLESDIAGSWDRLNHWHSRLKEDESSLDAKTRSLAARESALSAKDAELRGHLHDVTCFHEQVAAREKELERQLAVIQKEHDDVGCAASALEKREKEVNRRLEELKRREHVVAHRWTKLQRAVCPHCSKSVHLDGT